jgi:hypothetical protein
MFELRSMEDRSLVRHCLRHEIEVLEASGMVEGLSVRAVKSQGVARGWRGFGG